MDLNFWKETEFKKNGDSIDGEDETKIFDMLEDPKRDFRILFNSDKKPFSHSL
jgi:hypothetical protein